MRKLARFVILSASLMVLVQPSRALTMQSNVPRYPAEGLSNEMAAIVLTVERSATRSGCRSFRWIPTYNDDEWGRCERQGFIRERAYLMVINPTTHNSACFGTKGEISVDVAWCKNADVAHKLLASAKDDYEVRYESDSLMSDQGRFIVSAKAGYVIAMVLDDKLIVLANSLPSDVGIVDTLASDLGGQVVRAAPPN